MKNALLVSIEGLPGSGKSALQEYLAQRYSGVVVPDLWFFGGGAKKYSNIPKKYPEIRQREQKILSMNLAMLKVANKARNNHKSSFLHQNHVSSLAFSYASCRSFGIDTLGECKSDYFNKIYNKQLKLPDLYIFLKIPFSDFVKRCNKRGRYVNSIWFNEDFVSKYTKFYYLYTEQVEKIPTFFVDGMKTRNEIFSEATKIIDDFHPIRNDKIDGENFRNRFDSFVGNLD